MGIAAEAAPTSRSYEPLLRAAPTSRSYEPLLRAAPTSRSYEPLLRNDMSLELIMRTPLVAGNWKMHGDRQRLTQLAADICGTSFPNVEILLCPPFVYLDSVGQTVAGSGLALGSQDVAAEQSEGAYTGEVSAAMVADLGCQYAIVGHSERRALYGDHDDRVAEKFQAAQAVGLRPILCVGETLEERESGVTETVVARQLGAVLSAAGIEAFGKAVVAYEPVWAIGTGHTATPDQAQEVHARIRALVAEQDATIAAQLRILYGGSVKGANARDLLGMDDIDGGLVGGASLQASEFLKICEAASS